MEQVVLTNTLVLPSIATSGLVYFVWLILLPKLRGYEIRQVHEVLPDGAQANRLVKVNKADLAQWDATHDEFGAAIDPTTKDKSVSPIGSHST